MWSMVMDSPLTELVVVHTGPDHKLSPLGGLKEAHSGQLPPLTGLVMVHTGPDLKLPPLDGLKVAHSGPSS